MMNELHAETVMPFRRRLRRAWTTIAMFELAVAAQLITIRVGSFHEDDSNYRARLDVHSYADGATQWRRLHDGCPTIDELWALPGTPPLIDPWRSRYQVSCEANRIVVWSFGKDGTANTADDIRSAE